MRIFKSQEGESDYLRGYKDGARYVLRVQIFCAPLVILFLWPFTQLFARLFPA